ncbi:hypothetical protein MPER_14937, partial [Moniliophthora perniciosa FA553]
SGKNHHVCPDHASAQTIHQQFLAGQAFESVQTIKAIYQDLSTMSEPSFYSLKAALPGNKTFDFADLKGKVVLIVNTASACFTILGLPCNQ